MGRGETVLSFERTAIRTDGIEFIPREPKKKFEAGYRQSGHATLSKRSATVIMALACIEHAVF